VLLPVHAEYAALSPALPVEFQQKLSRTFVFFIVLGVTFLFTSALLMEDLSVILIAGVLPGVYRKFEPVTFRNF
jgi:hypothetical protein